MHSKIKHSKRRFRWFVRITAVVVFAVMSASGLAISHASSAVEDNGSDAVTMTGHSDNVVVVKPLTQANDKGWDDQNNYRQVRAQWKRTWQSKYAKAIRRAVRQHRAEILAASGETVVITGPKSKPKVSTVPSAVPGTPSRSPEALDSSTPEPSVPAPDNSADVPVHQDPIEEAPAKEDPPTALPDSPPAPPTAKQPAAKPQLNGTEWRVTVGTENKSLFDNSEPAGAGSAHGTRVYCTVSHFSHDDPIVYPGQPDAAHAHMFWGNTKADAFSTGSSIAEAGGSTCEGGTNNRSAYWTPVLFNAAGEAVLPESIIVYYKSFFRPDIGDRSTIQAIPNGLELLATSKVAGAGDWHFGVEAGGSNVSLMVTFPECLQVDAAGSPLLSSSDNISHTAYGRASTPSNCPASHPYRIPSVTYKLGYDVDADSAWSLSSDTDGPKGHSLHADYIAGWDATTMAALVECTIVERRNCGFDGGREQLPERFNTSSGEQIYKYSIQLSEAADRTPFGTDIGHHRQ